MTDRTRRHSEAPAGPDASSGAATPSRAGPSNPPAAPSPRADVGASTSSAAHGGAHQEIEAKFRIESRPAFDELTRLTELAARYPLGPARFAHLSDVYYDTPDRRLLRAGLVLRLRHRGETTLVTVKSLDLADRDAILSRTELEEEVPHGTPPPDAVTGSAALRELVLPVAGADPEWEAICLLRHARQTREVRAARAPAGPRLGAGRSVVGELALERVVVAAPDRLGRHRGVPDVVATLVEAEFELGSEGTRADLESIARWLGDRRGVSPERSSKLERSLRLIALHPPDGAPGALGLHPAMSLAEAGRLVWRRQLVEILLNEAGARRGEDIEFVHKMRVATRRARAFAELFGASFEPAAIRPILKGLRRTGRGLGPVRDVDVALTKLAGYRAGLRAEDAERLEPLDAHWRRARRRAYGALVRWLDSDRCSRFLIRFDRLCATPGAGVAAPRGARGPAVSDQLRHLLPPAILDRFSIVRSYEAALGAEAAASEATLHALRIDCKGLRYGLELAVDLLDQEGRALIKQLKKLQDLLGDLNDAVVARDTLRELRSAEVDQPAVRAYVAEQERIVGTLRSRFPDVWLGFIAPDNRRRLMRAIARL